MAVSKRTIHVAVLLTTAASGAFADRITLRDGNVIQAAYLGGTARQIRVDVNGSIQTFEIDRVRSISFTDEAGPQNYPTQPGYTDRNEPYPRQQPQGNYPNSPQPNYPQQQQPGGIIVPADTPITIRMIESVNSQTSRLGATYRASIDEPVVVDGQQVIPRGADVITKLVDDQKSGKLTGRTVLTLALVSITVNGRIVDVTSTDVRTASSSRGNRTAGVVGGGAAVGAIIGALAGGGKGAAIGAGSGAALGGATEVLTNGQQVKIPSETRLTFRLQTAAQL